MPRFHFHVRDGVDLPDREGSELPDRRSARLEAIRRAGDILAGAVDRVALGEEWRIEVSDHTGLLLFHMAFLVVDAPAPHDAAGGHRTVVPPGGDEPSEP